MNQTTEAKNYICVNCKLVTNHKQKRCIQCGCQTHEPTAADVTFPADTRHETEDHPLICHYCGGNGFTLGYENVHINCKYCKGTGELKP